MRSFGRPALAVHSGQSLIQIFDNVGGVFDADTDPDHLRPDAGLRCSSAVICRCVVDAGWQASDFRIADIDPAA